ncbi:MAG: hypothetical protein ABIA75_10125 [Candidatus Neomarinimicrobiota bacterium]
MKSEYQHRPFAAGQPAGPEMCILTGSLRKTAILLGLLALITIEIVVSIA